MIVFPNCKINLGLRVLRKRSDGYHDLDTVFYPLPFYDALELIANPSGDSIELTTSGLAVTADPALNLVAKAYQLLKKDHSSVPPIRAHLHKAIPAGAGLGGGSADGAFMLQLLNTRFHLGLTEQQLLAYALQLGSDCPFFIINQPCIAAGRGEQLEPIALDLSPYKFAIVNPGIHVSTAEAFADVQPGVTERPVQELLKEPLSSWRTFLINDFERSMVAKHPVIGSIKQQLYEAGAVYASMTGTGSTVFGIFPKAQRLDLNFPPSFFVKELSQA